LKRGLGSLCDWEYIGAMNEYSPIVSEFGSAEEEASYLAWLKAKVEASRADPRPSIPHDEVMAHIDRLLASKQAK
jgi:hypothetical protein